MEQGRGPRHEYSSVIVHRRPDLEARFKELGILPGERLAVAESAWRMGLDRAQEIDYLFVESNGHILNAARVLGAERVTQRDIDEHPEVEGRVRFITSHHLPDFVERLIGVEVGSFRHRNPVRYATLVHDLVSDTATFEAVH